LIDLKHVAMQLCTCTWIEIMTGAGITLYNMLYLGNYTLAAITVAVFAPPDHIPLCDDEAAAQQRRLAAKADDEVAGLDECFVQD